MIRAMAPSDRVTVANLVRQLGYEVTEDEVEGRIQAIVGRDDHLLLVVDFGVTVGWVHAYEVSLVEAERFVEVGGLVVSDTARRRGTGTLLMIEVEKWARERGIGTIRLRSRVKRKGAHRFYRARGYSEIKRQLTFEKRLEP